MTPDPSPLSAPPQGTPPTGSSPTRTNRAGHGAEKWTVTSSIRSDYVGLQDEHSYPVATMEGAIDSRLSNAKLIVSAFAELATLRQETERLKGELAEVRAEFSSYIDGSHKTNEELRATIAENDKAETRLKASNEALVGALADSANGLEVARRGLETARSCMANHEMQDSKYDNARNAIYTAAVASHATEQRARAAIRQSALATTAGTAVAPTEKGGGE